MAILSVNTTTTGTTGILPSVAEIKTNDTKAAVLATGYLNHVVQNGTSFSLPCMALVSTQTSLTAQPDVGWYEVQHSGSNWSLVATVAPGSVVLPTIANHFAVFTDTSGTLSEDAATAINAGNIQAGLTTGTLGALISAPASSAKGVLILSAIANTGNTNVTISNAAHGQASVYSIPDSGAATANFIVSKTTGTQHITVGALQVDAGVITTGLVGGGTAGGFSAYSATAANGALKLVPVASGGAFDTTISNGTMAQSTVYTIPDIGAATGDIVVSDGAIRMKSVAAAAAAGGAAAQSFTDAFCTSSSVVIGNWVTQTNAAEVVKIVPGVGSFVVTSTVDAGVGTFSYIITK